MGEDTRREMRLVGMDDPITRRIDGECETAIAALCTELNADPVAIASSMLVLLTRQMALINIEMAADLTDALAREIRSNYSNDDAALARIEATNRLVVAAMKRADEIIAQRGDGPLQ